MGNSLQEFIDNTQAYEAKVVKEQIEMLRQRKYDPVGSTYLYYWSDACPMIGSGLFDIVYTRKPQSTMNHGVVHGRWFAIMCLSCCKKDEKYIGSGIDLPIGIMLICPCELLMIR